ncbi:hypothetical protein [Acetivibrio clariflavus]|uniref:hypothetical protein n=1 Tax=Acetivibrio clariflavus TaxID=288965 RepID=UPI00031A8C95|nr:hypothetical protein [Acetivibrio clariflavus]
MKIKKILAVIFILGLCIFTIGFKVFDIFGINNKYKKLYLPRPEQELPEVQYEINEDLFDKLQQEAIVYKFKTDKNHKENA